MKNLRYIFIICVVSIAAICGIFSTNGYSIGAEHGHVSSILYTFFIDKDGDGEESVDDIRYVYVIENGVFRKYIQTCEGPSLEDDSNWNQTLILIESIDCIIDATFRYFTSPDRIEIEIKSTDYKTTGRIYKTQVLIE